MASGLPIVCSNVCDNGRYVEDGINGFLFDPKSPEDIALAVESMLAVDDVDYKKYCKESRRKAEEKLSKERFIESYLELIQKS